MAKFKILEGIVEQTLVMREGENRSTEVDSIHCFTSFGIQGDRHSGRRNSDVREDALKAFGLPKGIEIANFRQFSAVSVEQLNEIRDNLDLKFDILWGSLGENLVISGIADFTQLPPNTKLFFSAPNGEKRTAVLMVYGENNPCIIPGQNIAKDENNSKLATLFPKAAMHRRGVVGVVYCSGKIKSGDKVFAYLPN